MRDESRPAQLRLGILGYGEVGHGIALGLGKAGLRSIVAFQRAPRAPLTLERAQASGVRLLDSAAEVAQSADVLIAVTQGSQSVAIAQAVAPALRPHHLYVDLASASPAAKRQAAAVIAGSGALFADGVIEGSPLKYEHRFPVLASGPGAQRFADALEPWGMRISVIGVDVGRAALIKGLRHVMMKGQMALLVECLLAARQLGIQEEVLTTVAEWYDSRPFRESATALVRTTTVHAQRRAEEAAIGRDILIEAGIDPVMTRSTVESLERLASMGLRQSTGGVLPESLDAALDLLQGRPN